MQIQLFVREATDPGGIEIVVDTEAPATVYSLAGALAEALGHDPGSAPDLHIGGRPLDPRATIADAGVRDGVVLEVGAPVSPALEPRPENLTELRVVSGPGAGTVHRLGPGEYDIGTAPGCDVRLASETSGEPVGVRLRVGVDGLPELLGPTWATLDEQAIDGEVVWREGAQLAVDRTLVELARPHPDRRAPLTVAPDGIGLEFNRPPRFLPKNPVSKFRLPKAPEPPTKRPIPLLPLLLLPVGGAMTAILITGRWTFVFIALLSPIAALASQFSGRKQAQRMFEEETLKHDETMARLGEEVESVRLAEQHRRRDLMPDPAALVQMAAQPSDRLWERRWNDPDFLRLRVGTSDLPSMITVDDPKQDEHRRQTVPTVHQVPVSVDLREVGVLGVAGEAAVDLASWMTAQAATLHSPTDLRIAVLSGSDGEPSWGWTRWLPHARVLGEDAYVLVGSSTDSLARRIGELGQLIAGRAAAGPGLRRGGGEGHPDVLVVVENARRARSLPGVVGLLRDGPAVGVYVICLDRDERTLPEECGAVVQCEDRHQGIATVTAGEGAPLEDVRADLPVRLWFQQIGRAMAPLRGTQDRDDAALPATVRLLDLLGIEPPSAEAIIAGWSMGGRSTLATLGGGFDGPMTVDLVRDGPHALVAGTTGSGKSELLQTLVATLAVVNRPDEMTFVLIDYKGGSAFAECVDLPHTVGMVTDLDAHLVERALVSLGAELRRRETLLAGAGAKDIEDYQDKRSRGNDAIAPLPRLMLVIDEFASMVRELPDFVTGLVNIAQRGRSLGIHLVLATQRPGGAVTPDIRANTNLRIALRTTDTSESRDIIDAPDAGEIAPSAPGRAFVRLGPSVLLPFQSARVGGRRPGSDTTSDRPITTSAHPVGWTELGERPRVQASGQKQGAQRDQAVTDLAVLAAAVAQAAWTAGVPAQPSPWLPPLPEVLTWTRPAAPTPHPDRDARLEPVTFGLVDVPGSQTRRPLTFDLDRDGHLHLVGSARNGRSQALRTLTAALAAGHGVEDLHLYGIDCGNGALNALTSLPHCGAVVERRQVERLGRLLDRLNAELTSRQAAFGQRGSADLSELRASVERTERLPHIVVVVDRVEVFDRDLASFDNGSLMDRLIRLMRDGAGVGIHMILAGDRVLGGSRYAGTTENKLVLGLNDRQDYSAVGIPTRSAPDNQPPGRAIRVADMCEVQVAVLSDDLAGAAQAAEITALGRELTSRESNVSDRYRPMRLDVLPDQLSYSDAVEMGTAPRALWARVAVAGDTLAFTGPDLAENPSFVIAGPPRSGRSSALMVAAESLLETGSGLVVLAPRRSPLRSFKDRDGVAGVLVDPEVTLGEFREVMSQVPQDTGVVIVDDAETYRGSDLDSDLSAIARGSLGTGWAVVAAGNAEAFSMSLAGWIGQLKRNRTGLLLSPQSMAEGEVIGTRLTRGQVSATVQPGRGLLHLGDSQPMMTQVPTPPFALPHGEQRRNPQS